MMTRIEHDTWFNVASIVKNIRNTVFVHEWRIPAHVEFDLDDIQAEHVIVYNDGQPIATGRLCPNGYMSRIAVMPSSRRTNAAEQVFNTLLALAKQHQIEDITISSDIQHIDQVKRVGFVSEGKVYMEAGVARQKLKCPTKSFQPVNWDWLH